MGPGKVYIVGAGPGAPDLITLRGLRALRRADAVVADALVPAAVLDQFARPGARVERLDAHSARDQSAVTFRLAELAAQGLAVVRLKNGDPCVFARAMEEAVQLWRAGVPCEVVPGLSAALAGPAAAGLPLTRRGSARSFAVTTATVEGGKVNVDLPHADSLVLLMGVGRLEHLTAVLLKRGWNGSAPAAVIERAQMEWERRVYAPLTRLAKAARAAGVRSPALILVGPAAARPEQTRPLVLFTGLDPANFRAIGDLLHWPALHMEEAPGAERAFQKAAGALERGDVRWAVFTSRAGVEAFFARLRRHRLDARALAGVRVAAAGAGTARRLAEFGIVADMCPAEAGSGGLLAALPRRLHGTLLLVQGTHAPAGLAQALQDRGAHVLRAGLHRVVPHPELGRPLPEHDVIYFVSPSGVAAYWEVYGPAAFRKRIWCIGPVTARAVEMLGFQAEVISPHEPTGTHETAKAH